MVEKEVSMSIASLWRAKSKRRAAGQAFVPRLVVLEDRTLPSTFTVLNLNDTSKR